MKFLIATIFLFSLSFISCHKNSNQAEATGAEKDSATLAQDTIFSKETIENNKIVATGTVAGYEFNATSRLIANIDMMLENGMEMLMNDKEYAEMKLLDEKKGITLSVRIIDMDLLDKIPFSYSFTEGDKLIITVFIKNKEGINEMYGGTIRNIKGRFSVTGMNKTTNTLIGSLDAELTNVLDNDNKCKIEGLRFYNAKFFLSKKSSNIDSSMFKDKNSTIVQ